MALEIRPLSRSTLPALSLFLAVAAASTSPRLLSDSDICLDFVEFPISTICGHDWPLGDQRLSSSGDSEQCRAFCKFNEPDEDFFQVTHYATGCNFCQQDDVNQYVITSSAGDPNICVPRGRCIKECGEERPGCVYTGSCASQVCFLGLDETPTEKKRVTHHGPASIFELNNPPGEEDGTVVSTAVGDPGLIPDTVYNGVDSCPGRGVSFPTAIICGGDGPFDDGRGESGGGQCRSVCKFFDRGQYEVVRVYRVCSFCDADDADEFFDDTTGEDRICIPRQRCIDECGPEGPGCVYTGSCQSRICFSGIDSKKPAEFTTFTDDGANAIITVDNSGPPISTDPPVFADETDETQTPGSSSSASPIPTSDTVGGGSTAPSPSQAASTGQVSPSPSPSKTTPTAPVSEIDAANTSDSKEEKGTSLWVWLGPLLAALAIAIVAVVVVTSYITGRRNPGAYQPTPAG